jgi:hypothetical protein
MNTKKLQLAKLKRRSGRIHIGIYIYTDMNLVMWNVSLLSSYHSTIYVESEGHLWTIVNICYIIHVIRILNWKRFLNFSDNGHILYSY